jgi:hypothetical protein
MASDNANRKLHHADSSGHTATLVKTRDIYEAISATELQQLLSDRNITMIGRGAIAGSSSTAIYIDRIAQRTNGFQCYTDLSATGTAAAIFIPFGGSKGQPYLTHPFHPLTVH